MQLTRAPSRIDMLNLIDTPIDGGLWLSTAETTSPLLDSVPKYILSEDISLSSSAHRIRAGVPMSGGMLTASEQSMMATPDSLFTYVALGPSLNSSDGVVISHFYPFVPEEDGGWVRLLSGLTQTAIDEAIIIDAEGKKHPIGHPLYFKSLTQQYKIPTGAYRLQLRLHGETAVTTFSGYMADMPATLIILKPRDSALKVVQFDPWFPWYNIPRRLDTLVSAEEFPNAVRAVNLIQHYPDLHIIRYYDGFDSGDIMGNDTLSFNSATKSYRDQPELVELIYVDSNGAGWRYPAWKRDSVVMIVSVGDSSDQWGVPELYSPIDTRTAAGESRVRILNALVGSDSLDIEMNLAGDTTRLHSLKFLGFNQYASMRSGPVSITLRKSSNGHILWKGIGTLPSGYFTIIPNGSMAPDEIGVSVLFDSDEEEQRPMMRLNAIPFDTTVTDTTRGVMRIVNLRTAPEEIFARFSHRDSAQIVSDAASQWWSERTGTRTEKIELRGTQTAELPSMILRSDTLTTVVIFGASTPYPDIQLLDAPLIQSVPADKCALRILNATVGVGNLDLQLLPSGSTSAITIPLPYGQPTAYTEIEAGAAKVQIYPAGNTTILGTLNGVLPAGAIATMLVRGSETSPVVELLIDSDSSAQSLMRFDAIASLSVAEVEDSITIRPNPAVTGVELWLVNRDGATGSVEMYDMLGSLIYATPLKQATGPQRVVIELDAIPAGSYSLVVHRAQHTLVRRVVVVH
jgi:hypothetical protein